MSLIRMTCGEGGNYNTEVLRSNVNSLVDSAINGNKNTIALLGDSVTDYNTVSQGNASNGYWSWANVAMRHAFDLVKEAGVSGNTSSHILGRVDTDILTLNPLPRFCLVLAGTNDAYKDFSAESAVANIEAIYDKLTAAGITPIACTIPPMDQVDSRKLVAAKINDWIREYCYSNNMTLVDFNKVLSSDTNGWYLPAYSADTIHPTLLAANVMGKECAKALLPLVNPNNKLISTNMDDNALSNGMFSGDTAGKASTWLVAGGTSTKVVRTDGTAGTWQQVVFSDVKVTLKSETIDTGGYLSAGDTAFAQIEFELERSGTMKQLYLVLACNGASGVTYDLYTDPSKQGDFDISSGILKTPPLTIPVGATSYYLSVVCEGSGTIRVARASIKKI